MDPLASIVVPMYNAEPYIQKTIKSVLDQTFTDWELIIIDDGSKDKSLSIAKEYEKKENRIHVYANDGNHGVSYTRNRAIALAKGKYIALLDADDLWHPDKLLKQIPFMEEHNYEVSYCSYQKMTVDEEMKGLIKVPKKMNYRTLLKGCLINCITGVFLREKFSHIQFKDTKVEDYIFWLELFKEIDYAYGIPDCLAFYRVQKGSRSSNKITIVKYHWTIYRHIEKLGMISSLYYFAIYFIKGIIRFIS